LASALIKLERHKPKGILERIFGTTDGVRQPNMLRTHPPTDERVEALMQLEPELVAQDALNESFRRLVDLWFPTSRASAADRHII